MKRSDIGDHAILAACLSIGAHGNPHYGRSVVDVLVEQTGAPEKVVCSALKRTADRGLIEYGVSIRFPWLTDEGRKVLESVD